MNDERLTMNEKGPAAKSGRAFFIANFYQSLYNKYVSFLLYTT